MNRAMEPLQELPIRHLRNTGMIWAFDVLTDSPGFARDFYQEALALGLLLRPIGNTVYFMPPYVIADDEIDWLAQQTHALLCKMLKSAG
jgi:adenosylmethionine-8-amino-7-oxononanoate aminotransferase